MAAEIYWRVCVFAVVVRSRTVSEGERPVDSGEHKVTATLVNLVNFISHFFKALYVYPLI